MAAREELWSLFYRDRPLAHREIFAERHHDSTPPYHDQVINDWHGPDEYVIDLIFRGGGKSTVAEEAIIIMAGFREFRNGIVVSYSVQKAMERVHAIRHEIETNDRIKQVFGDLIGPSIWGDGELVLSNGIRILAMGRGQSIRGVKFEEARPDVVFVDDVEDEPDVRTPEARAKVWAWVTKALIPACEPPGRRKIRMAATPLHPESTAVRLQKSPEWKDKTIPIYYLDKEGEPQSSWPDRWPIDKVLALEATTDIQAFRQEYMCQAEAPETKLFKQEMMKVEPRVRTWQAAYAMFDPARTTTRTAATTGMACWSWIGPKLVIWDAWARRIMPDEIVNSLFDIDDAHHPVHIGFEEDGLNQWALQPIRQEQVRRGHVLPLKAMKAPVGKLAFIGGLQTWFRAMDVQFAKPLPDLQQQLLGFPNGPIDAPNALAYAPRMRPGAPIYDAFGDRNVGLDLRPAQSAPLWLVLNATRRLVTASVCQIVDGGLRVFGDYLREGDPAMVLADIIQAASLEFHDDLRLTAGPAHFERYTNVGLQQAITRLPRQIERSGTTPDRGRDTLRKLLEAEKHGMPAVMVSDKATWTLRGFSGGYARVLQKHGMLADYAEEGEYRVIMEGLESFAGLMEVGLGEGSERASFNATTAQGRQYRSMVAGNVHPQESKSDWNALLRGG